VGPFLPARRRAVCPAAFAAAAVVLLLSPASGQEPVDVALTGEALEFEQRIHEELAAVAPEAVPIFEEASSAYRRTDFASAKPAFERVLELAPGFPAALRRLSFCELSFENVDASIRLAREAVAVDESPDESPDNLSMLAFALASTFDGRSLSEAMGYADRAAREDPEGSWTQLVLAQVALANGREERLAAAVAALLRIAPEYPGTHMFAGSTPRRASSARRSSAGRPRSYAKPSAWASPETRGSTG